MRLILDLNLNLLFYLFPTISIITPSFNQGAFLEETILSVLSQEGDFSIDYIVVDGGSTDNSVETIRKYDVLIREGGYPVRCRNIRYRWVSEMDQSQTEAINKGMAMAEGVFCGWLNSDDTYLPGTIEKVTHFFSENPSAGLVYGKSYFVDERGGRMDEVPTGRVDYGTLASLNLVCQPSAFFKRQVWIEAGELNPELHYTMDHDLWIRIARKYELAYIEEFLSTYRLHSSSKSLSPEHAVDFHREILKTIMRHYHWAPANRVYGYCYTLAMHMLPSQLARFTPLVVVSAALMSVVEYLRLNKGRIRGHDIKMLNRANLLKVLRGSVDKRRG
jgi:glycosyltransferase involved in cell wall biosynthesis